MKQISKARKEHQSTKIFLIYRQEMPFEQHRNYFVRPHLDYGNIVYDQPSNQSYSNNIEDIQRNASLTIITNTVKGIFRTKLSH